MDSILHATVCKHVHLVKMVTNKAIDKGINDQNHMEYFSSVLEDDRKDCEFTKIHQGILQKLSEISVLVRNSQNIATFNVTSHT